MTVANHNITSAMMMWLMMLVMFLLFYFSWMACLMMCINGEPASRDDAGEGA